MHEEVGLQNLRKFDDVILECSLWTIYQEYFTISPRRQEGNLTQHIVIFVIGHPWGIGGRRVNEI